MKTIGVEYDALASGGARTPPAASKSSSAQPTLASAKSWRCSAYCVLWKAINVGSEGDGRSDSRKVMFSADNMSCRGTFLS